MKINKTTYWTILAVLIVIVLFMLKLPRVFRNYDKELHFLFYFYASFIISIFYVKKKLTNFFISIFSLLIFGIFIEYFQEYSNSFFKKRIHGRFDIEDIKYNILGLILFNSLWFMNYIIIKLKFIKNERTS